MSPEVDWTPEQEALLFSLSAKELTALADYWENERWVWQQVAEVEERKGEDSEKARWLESISRRRAREFKEMAAKEEHVQSEWEENSKET